MTQISGEGCLLPVFREGWAPLRNRSNEGITLLAPRASLCIPQAPMHAFVDANGVDLSRRADPPTL